MFLKRVSQILKIVTQRLLLQIVFVVSFVHRYEISIGVFLKVGIIVENHFVDIAILQGLYGPHSSPRTSTVICVVAFGCTQLVKPFV